MPKKSKHTVDLPAIKQLPSGSWHAKVYTHTDAAGKKQFKSFTHKDKNKLIMQIVEFKSDLQADKLEAANERGNPTLGDAMDQYIEAKNALLSPSTIVGYRQIRRNALPDLIPLRVQTITQDQIQRAINQEVLSKSPKTVRNIHGFLAAVMAVHRPSLVLHTTLPQKVKSEIAIPTEAEIKRLVSAAEGTEMELPVILAACCGMRRSEISALTWDCVDFSANTIAIKQALVLDENNELVQKTTKTVAGTRTIRMFPIVSDALIRHREKFPPRDGKYITIKPDTISQRFFHLLNRADVPHYRFHDLRHYTVSVMLSLNIPKNYIADFVGHETENMIDQVYGHILKSKKTSFEDLLQTFYSGVFSE